MNKIFRVTIFAAIFVLGWTTPHLQAQVSIQRLTFSLLAEFPTNSFSTNTTASITNNFEKIRTVLVATRDVVKAIAVDIDGTNLPVWNGSDLVREVSLTNGAEGIFLRKAGSQTNVSPYFVGSFSNNFTADLAYAFPAAFTNFGTNVVTAAQLQLHRGVLSTSATNAVTNYTKTAGLHFVSLSTTNLKLNLVAVGDGQVTTIGGAIAGNRYHGIIDSETLGSAGSFLLEVNTNLYNLGTNISPQFVAGPIRGSVVLGEPVFLPITGP